ncbi:hypothetical protein B2M20_00885 [Nitrobacter vulgaris]|uniref:Uncharacterized protein n=1 Tax=Nitrobacter vulgaris TaxID=29421 RepID=A0A1V4I3Z4_NITVU|nr:hypothetical protein B2M20_00885 [Nitrobacter vulgaris]
MLSSAKASRGRMRGLDQDDLGIGSIMINRLQYFGVDAGLCSSLLQKATALNAPPLPVNSAAQSTRLIQRILARILIAGRYPFFAA